MKALALLLFSLAVITPYLATCPKDGTLASATGKTRVTDDGKTECEYKHIHFVVTGDGDNEKMVDEPHVFWEACTVENK